MKHEKHIMHHEILFSLNCINWKSSNLQKGYPNESKKRVRKRYCNIVLFKESEMLLNCFMIKICAILHTVNHFAGANRVFRCNLGQNICRLSHLLAQLPFTTTGTKLDYHHQKVNVRVASRVAKRLKTQDLRKLDI